MENKLSHQTSALTDAAQLLPACILSRHTRAPALKKNKMRKSKNIERGKSSEPII
jgi:hypothetical protein